MNQQEVNIQLWYEAVIDGGKWKTILCFTFMHVSETWRSNTFSIYQTWSGSEIRSDPEMECSNTFLQILVNKNKNNIVHGRFCWIRWCLCWHRWMKTPKSLQSKKLASQSHDNHAHVKPKLQWDLEWVYLWNRISLIIPTFYHGVQSPHTSASYMRLCSCINYRPSIQIASIFVDAKIMPIKNITTCRHVGGCVHN